MLSEMAICNHESDSKPQIDLQYRSDAISDSDSDNQPLAIKQPSISAKRKHNSSTRIIPDKLSITFGDNASVLVKSKKQVARKTIMRRAKEPRGTLKPLWNIIPDGTITNYTPHTITIDTRTRKNTVIRKSHIAIAADKRTLVRTIQAKPQLMELVVLKTIGEYNRNTEKLRKFYLDEQKAKYVDKRPQADTQTDTEDIPTNDEQPRSSNATTKTKQKRTQRKANTKSPKRKERKPTKRTNNQKATLFETKSNQAALAQSKLEQPKRRQQQPRRKTSFVQTELDSWSNSETVEVINLISDSPQQSPIAIVTSKSPIDFMTQAGPRTKNQ